MLARTIALFTLTLFATACAPREKAAPAAAPLTDDTLQMLKATFGVGNVGTVAAVGKDNLVAVTGLTADGWQKDEIVTFMDGQQQTIAQGTFYKVSEGFPIIQLKEGQTVPSVGMAAVRVTGAAATPKTPAAPGASATAPAVVPAVTPAVTPAVVPAVTPATTK